MSFRNLCLAVSVLFGILCLTLIVLPGIVYWLFGLEGNALGDFLAKRAGVLFLGLALLCFVARLSTSAEVQRLIALSIGTAMGAMAVLGLYEWARGSAGPGIALAIGIELVIAALFFRLLGQIHQKTA